VRRKREGCLLMHITQKYVDAARIGPPWKRPVTTQATQSEPEPEHSSHVTVSARLLSEH